MDSLELEPKIDDVQQENLNVSMSVIEARQAHGLRHDDFQRYRKYCSRRLRNLRQNLKMTNIHTNKKFSKPELEAERPSTSSIKVLLIFLMEAERAWSFAMQLKQELQSPNASSRLKHRSNRRLKKAVENAENLEKISNSLKCTVKTKLECQAYHSWIHGALL
ncbi:hypothetical protein ACOME3_008438 [Neoechinorhynchus agilis]